MTKDNKYIVATRCMTYNQAPYINETLRGFTLQETTFPVVFIIVDDASDDGEQELLCGWAENNLLLREDGIAYRKHLPYGELIFARHKNRQNSHFVILLLAENLTRIGKGSLKTKYISEWNDSAKYKAICEGDDYWIHPRKLQMQVEFLENHPEAGLVYTDINRYYQKDGRYEKDFFKTLPIKNTHDDFLFNSWFLAPCSWVYRSELSKMQPKLDNTKYFTGDTLWVLTYSKHSKVCFMDEVTATYRVLETSASHFGDYNKQMNFQKKNINTRIYFAKDQNMAFRLRFWWKVVRESRPPRKKIIKYGTSWIKDSMGYFINLMFC